MRVLKHLFHGNYFSSVNDLSRELASNKNIALRITNDGMHYRFLSSFAQVPSRGLPYFHPHSSLQTLSPKLFRFSRNKPTSEPIWIGTSDRMNQTFPNQTLVEVCTKKLEMLQRQRRRNKDNSCSFQETVYTPFTVIPDWNPFSSFFSNESFSWYPSYSDVLHKADKENPIVIMLPLYGDYFCQNRTTQERPQGTITGELQTREIFFELNLPIERSLLFSSPSRRLTDSDLISAIQEVFCFCRVWQVASALFFLLTVSSSVRISCARDPSHRLSSSQRHVRKFPRVYEPPTHSRFRVCW